MALSTSLSSINTSVGDSRRSSIRPGHFHNHRRAPVTRRIDDRLESSTDMGRIDFDVDEALERGRALFDNAGPALKAALEIIEDPYLPEVACHVTRLARIERGELPGPNCPRTQMTPTLDKRGIGLRLAIKPLRAVAWARLNPLLASALGVSIIGVLIGVGIAIGKGRTR